MNPGNPATTILIITDGSNATLNWLRYMNGSSFHTDYSDLVLLLAKEGNVSYPYSPQCDVVNTGTSSSNRITVNNTTGPHHPMHYHGHNFFGISLHPILLVLNINKATPRS